MQTEAPADWRWSRIGDHFKRITRKNKAGVTRVLTASGEHGLIDQEEYFNKRVAAKNVDGYFHLKRGEFAYNRSSMNGYPFGATKRLDRYDDGVLSTLYLCLGLKLESGLLSDYAAQLFDSRVLDAELQPIVRVGARAHGLLNVTPSDFLEVSFPLPPPVEQEKIAAVLSSVDEAIQASEAVIEQTRRVKDGLLQDLLTRGIGHTRFKQTEIGEVPESWEVRPLADLAAEGGMVGGPFGSDLTASDYAPAPGVPVIRGANVSPSEFNEHEFVYVTDAKAESLKRNTATRGDLVMTQRGASLGQAALIPHDSEFGTYIVSQTMMRMTPDPNEVLADYLIQYVTSPVGQGWLQSQQTGNAQPHLNLTIFRAMPAPVPPLPEQQEITARCEAMDKAIEVSEARLHSLGTVKAGLLQDLLTGAVRVSP